MEGKIAEDHRRSKMALATKVKNWLSGTERDQARWIKDEADKWRESGESRSYREEISRRREYLDGDMESDALALLKREFQKIWPEMRYKMVLWPMVKYIIQKKAQVFRGVGARFYLKDPKQGEEIDSASTEAQSFNAMMESGMVESQLVEIDRTEELMYACAAKIGWDVDHLDINIYDPDKIHIAVNGERENDPYSAFAVSFERSGYDGITSTPRYEVWGYRDPKIAADTDQDGARIFHPTLHYMSTSEGGRQVNEFDANPFIDRRNGKPMYPFTWFRGHKRCIYKLGGDDLVRFSRVLNLGMTYLNHNMSWQMAAIPTFEVTPGQNISALDKIKKIIMASPQHAATLPPGVVLKFARPDVVLGPFMDVYQVLVQYYALMNHLSPKSIDVQGGLPQSGIALKIEMDGLNKYREDRIRALRPHVIDFINRCIVVWNYYAPKLRAGWKKIPDGLVVGWDPGRLDAGPIDYVELNDRFQVQCENNVSNVYEWTAALHQIDINTAEERWHANEEVNRQWRNSKTMYPAENRPGPDEEEIDNMIGEEPEDQFQT